MKIVAGLGTADAYNAYADAGADEVFCGYVPEAWAQHYGMALPLNRREVRYYHVQLGGRSELLYLAEQIVRRGVPATITLNSLHYVPEQYPLIAETVAQCCEDGFRSFIVADLALLIYLHQQGLDQQAYFHISGEMGEVNHSMISLCRSLGAARMIFHRKVTLAEMKACIGHEATNNAMEYEAFLLNEMCHFHGAFCNSLHCDELAHMCRVPYRLGHVERNKTDVGSALDHLWQAPIADAADPSSCTIVADSSSLGATGCGLCALWRMKQAGVTHLKIVGRGNHTDVMARDISAVRQALLLLDEAHSEKAFIQSMRNRLFPAGCNGQCYYHE